MRCWAEPFEHELWHGAHTGAVVEGHHDDAKEHHRGYSADPKVMDRRDADLGSISRHSHDLDGAEVRRHECQPCHPSGQAASGQEEVEGVGHLMSGGQSDSQDEHEVNEQYQVINEPCVDECLQRHGAEWSFRLVRGRNGLVGVAPWGTIDPSAA